MIDNGHQQIFCPSYKCLSKQSISIDEIKIIITNEQYREKIHTLFTKNQNIDSKLNNDEQENQQQLQCPFCQHLIDNDKDNDDDNMKSHLFQRKIKKENNIDKNNNEIDNEIVVVEQQKSIRIVKCPSVSYFFEILKCFTFFLLYSVQKYIALPVHQNYRMKIVNMIVVN